jgi:hypothetical protein
MVRARLLSTDDDQDTFARLVVQRPRAWPEMKSATSAIKKRPVENDWATGDRA